MGFRTNLIITPEIMEDLIDEVIIFPDRRIDIVINGQSVPSVSAVRQHWTRTEKEFLWDRRVTSSCYKFACSKPIFFIDRRGDDYREFKSNYEEKAKQYRQRYLEIMSIIIERKIENMKMQEKSNMLAVFTKSLKLTGELVYRFIRRIEVFRDGRIYVEFIDVNN